MLIRADARAIPLRDATVQCCVTSPPYFAQRDYGVAGQIGLERTVGEYVAVMVEVLREIRRVLKPDGVLFLNLGDCHYSSDRGGWRGDAHRWEKSELQRHNRGNANTVRPNRMPQAGLKDKDLIGVPWRVALAAQADGWWLRSDIVWSKTACMPESIKDRPTRSHEYIFLLTKSGQYFYNADAIREPHIYGNNGDHHRNVDGSGKWQPPGVESPHRGLHRAKTSGPGPHLGRRRQAPEPGEVGAFHPLGKNKRTVWTINPQPYPGSHFATFPEEIPRLCILAGSRPGDVILDPFGGSGTTAKVALELGRRPIHLDLTYHDLAKQRCMTTPALAGLV